MIKRIASLLLLVIGFFCFGPASVQAAPKNLKKHALTKVLLAPVKVASVAPKAAAKGVAYTVGGVLFAAESGVDVVHLAADVVAKGTQAEGWTKANVFAKVDDVVGYADSGLETAYNFLFHVQI